MTKADQQRYLNAAMVPAADIHKAAYRPLRAVDADCQLTALVRAQ